MRRISVSPKAGGQCDDADTLVASRTPKVNRAPPLMAFSEHAQQQTEG